MNKIEAQEIVHTAIEKEYTIKEIDKIQSEFFKRRWEKEYTIKEIDKVIEELNNDRRKFTEALKELRDI